MLVSSLPSYSNGYYIVVNLHIRLERDQGQGEKFSRRFFTSFSISLKASFIILVKLGLKGLRRGRTAKENRRKRTR
jgi:hypothetical protein